MGSPDVDSVCPAPSPCRWYKLHSKAGKKEKERGEIQVTVQFTRNTLSASMFDLSVKDKPRSPFGKIKDKMKGKKKYELESASAIIPSSALDDPDLLGGSSKKAKAKAFFLRNKLRKSSLTQSNTSLGSDSTLSSTSGSLAWLGSEYLTRSPSRHSRLSTEGGKDSASSPKLLTHKRAYSDEVSQVQAGLPRAGHDPGSGSSLCINGSHIYNDEPSVPQAHRASISGPFPSASALHGLSLRRAEEGTGPSDTAPGGSSEPVAAAGVGREESGARAGEEEGPRRAEGKPVQVATPIVFPSTSAEREDGRKEERKTRVGLFHHHHHGAGRRGSLGEKMGLALGASLHPSSSGEEKGRSGWFGSREGKEHTQKPSGSLVAAPTAPSLPEWDDTFDAFAASRLPPDAGHGLSAPAAERGALGALQAGDDDVQMAGSQEAPRGGGGGSVSAPEASGPLSLDGWSVAPAGWESPVFRGPSPSLAAEWPSPSREPEEETPCQRQEADQHPEAPEAACPRPRRRVSAEQERSPNPGASTEPEEEPRSVESHFFQELNVVTDLWSSEMVNIPPVSRSPPPIPKRSWEQEESLWGALDEPPGLQEPGSPGPPPDSAGDVDREVFSPPPDKGEGSPAPEPGSPPPKPPRLFTPMNSQNEEEEMNPGELSREGTELCVEDICPGLPALHHQDEMEGGALGVEELEICPTVDRPDQRASEGDSVSCWDPVPRVPEPGSPPAVLDVPSPTLTSQSKAGQSQHFWAVQEAESQFLGMLGTLQDKPEPPGPLVTAGLEKDPFWASDDDDDDTLSSSLPRGSPASTILPALLSAGDEASPESPSLELVAPQDPLLAPPLPPPLPSPCPATNVSRKPGQESLSLHGSRPFSFSTPAPMDFPATRGPFEFPSPIEGSSSPQWGIETPSTLLALLPLETRPAEEPSSQPGAR
ncbi:histone-lysine N-methyltransferase 2D-like isoform X2 [Vombatus ursinus]|uniref:histone-lysine N-methyltransferase 2D-like isoform X2 n=1 Tax=Vombatus ursinus TaxID=29139 RepID=UPI000FFD533F|nr:histone-lysine N-methyltransferase 2D-like isoform X2 [Vombatus ursinus]XP_027706580.1 histone-lysine N-methyltransferase 2D-like isoform X2 [Vombatus ursinus]